MNSQRILVAQRLFSSKIDEDTDADFQPEVKNAFTGKEEAKEEIEKWVTENDVVLFMKGTLKMPRCGFSNYVTAVLKFYNLKNVKDVNVLEDEVIRETIKEFSNWPTLPQLYVKG